MSNTNTVCFICKKPNDGFGVCDTCVDKKGYQYKKFVDAHFLDKMQSVFKSISEWSQYGFPIPDPETFNTRLETCKGCEFWDETGFAKTGRCEKCGCSTQAKLRMATEKCPIGKW
jgi:hypothetical protein